MAADRTRTDWQRNGIGSTGNDHPFRNRAKRQIRQIQERAVGGLESPESHDLHQRALEVQYGLHVDLEALQGDLGELERFEADRGLASAGIDRVMRRFEDAFNGGEINET